MIIKILVTLFVVFAVSRVILRYRDGNVGLLAMFGWGILWLGIDAFIWWPKVSDTFAHLLGVSRGADALLFVGLMIVFYAVFRVYIKLEFLEHEITSLVRGLAIRDGEHAQPIQHANGNPASKDR